MVRLWKTAWPCSWRSVNMTYHPEDFFLTALKDTSLTLLLTVFWHCFRHFAENAIDCLLTFPLTVYWYFCWQFTDIAVASLLILRSTVCWQCCWQFPDTVVDSLVTVFSTVCWQWCWQFTDIAFDSTHANFFFNVKILTDLTLWQSDNVLRVHPMHMYRGKRRTVPPLFNLSSEWRWIVTLGSSLIIRNT